MALRIVLEEEVARELAGHPIAGKVINDLRTASTFESVLAADKYFHELNSRYYDPKDWAHQGVAVNRHLSHGNTGMVLDAVSYDIGSITNLPFRLNIVEGTKETVNLVVRELPIYVAWEPLEHKSKVAAYLVAQP